MVVDMTTTTTSAKFIIEIATLKPGTDWVTHWDWIDHEDGYRERYEWTTAEIEDLDELGEQEGTCFSFESAINVVLGEIAVHASRRFANRFAVRFSVAPAERVEGADLSFIATCWQTLDDARRSCEMMLKPV